MADEPDYDDPAVEEAWCQSRGHEVAAYLQDQKLEHGRVGEWPAWHVPPVGSIWAVESAATPGAMGWWVICGDLPTDYLSASEAADPREAVAAFAARWSEAAGAMRAGHEPLTMRIAGSAAERQSLAPMLESRAKLLANWSERDDVWDDIFDDD